MQPLYKEEARYDSASASQLVNSNEKLHYKKKAASLSISKNRLLMTTTMMMMMLKTVIV